MMKSFDIKPPPEMARPAGPPERRRNGEAEDAAADFAGSMASLNRQHLPQAKDSPSPGSDGPRPAIPDLPIIDTQPPAAAPVGAVIAATTEVHFDTSQLRPLPALAFADRPAGTAQRDMSRSTEPLKVLTIELAPDDDLGTIKAVLRLRNDGLDVKLQSDRGAVAARLQGSAESLATSLEQAGYAIETVSAQLVPKPIQSTANGQASDVRRPRGPKNSGESDDEASGGHRPVAGEPVFL